MNFQLKARRAELAQYFHQINNPTSLVEFQLRLVNEIKQAESALSQSRDEEWRQHLHLVRCFGDSLAWQYLHPHTIRQLSKNQWRLPNLTSQGEAFDLTLEVAQASAKKGRFALIADLTNCLRIADVIIAEHPEYPILIECKRSKSSGTHPLRGRALRQYSRMKGTHQYLTRGTAKVFGEDFTRIAIETHTPPEYQWNIIDDLYLEVNSTSKTAYRILSQWEAIFIAKDALTLEFPNKLISDGFNGEGAFVANHLRAIEEAWPTIAPPLVWNISHDARLSLLEGDYHLIHIFNPEGLIGSKSEWGEIIEVEYFSEDNEADHAYVVNARGSRVSATSNFTTQVLYGFESPSSVARRILEFCGRSLDVLPPEKID